MASAPNGPYANNIGNIYAPQAPNVDFLIINSMNGALTSGSSSASYYIGNSSMVEVVAAILSGTTSYSSGSGSLAVTVVPIEYASGLPVGITYSANTISSLGATTSVVINNLSGFLGDAVKVGWTQTGTSSWSVNLRLIAKKFI